MHIDSGLVSHVAKLASLELTAAEAEAMSGQLTRIVEHFEALKTIPDDLLEATADFPRMVLRADEAVSAPFPEIFSSNAPELSHGHFVVPRVVSRSE